MKIKGIVLKSKNLGDKLRHISLYTDKLGKINLVFRLDNSQFPIKFEPFSISEFDVIQKENRYELREAKLIEHNFPKSFDELFYRAKISKLIYPYELQPSNKLFNLIRTYMRLNENLDLSYVAFLSKFLFIEGLFPRIFSCVKCGSRKIVAFSLEKGGVVCKRCRERGNPSWSRETSLQLKEIVKNPVNELRNRRLSQLNRIKSVLEKHAQFHLNK